MTRSTTTIWTFADPDEAMAIGYQLRTKALEIIGDDTFEPTLKIEWTDTTTEKVTRTWPTLEIAEQWVEFVTGLGATSSVDPE